MSFTARSAVAPTRFLLRGLGDLCARSVLSATQRTREIGIRMALGAAHADVLRMVLRHGARLTLLGVAIGLAAAFGVTRLIASLLFVSATDAMTFATISVLLAAVAMLASLLPARRAARVDPLGALRPGMLSVEPIS